MNKNEALEELDRAAQDFTAAQEVREKAVIAAALAGVSQREIARHGKLSVMTVRKVLDTHEITYKGQKYEHKES